MRRTAKETVNGELKLGWKETPFGEATVDETRSDGVPTAGCTATILCIALPDAEIEDLSDKMLSRTD